jgi:hypothetical protein
VSLPGEQFRLTANGKVYAVVDLSLSGLALRILGVDERVLFPVGVRLEGHLNLNRRKYRVELTVKNLRGDQVGCELVRIDAELHDALEHWLSPSNLGKSLRPLPMPMGFGGARSEWIWFHGRSGTELLAQVSGSEGALTLERLLLVFTGTQFVEWSLPHQIISGEVRQVDAFGPMGGIFRVEPEWFHADAVLDPAKLALAETLVMSSTLPEAWKDWVSDCRKRSNHGS